MNAKLPDILPTELSKNDFFEILSIFFGLRQIFGLLFRQILFKVILK